ncbi:MAG: sigma 54-interacting transcriptional regulator [Pseudomonadota bacterium]|nr:sigma 54-interacting transcriptional regulator [Pseudomonadota bacterium]
MQTTDATTLAEGEPACRRCEPSGWRLTLLHHPDAARVGETLVLPGSVRSILLSRGAPAWPGGPIGDPYVSRSPVELVVLPDGSLVGQGTAAWSVDGAPGRPGLAVPAATLERGVAVGLARRAIVWVERGAEPAVPCDALGLVGASRAMGALRAQIARLAPHVDPVLVRGETGSGKEHVARALHLEGPRARRPLVVVNLGAIPASTAASQLFGHAAGAFTGATRAHEGYFVAADGGTLFLDELGELPEGEQPLLLRALDSREIQPVGGRARVVDVRLVAATDADLEAAVDARTFRAALLHRLAVQVIHVPPLRERPVDVAVQAAAFLRERKAGVRAPCFSTMEAMLAYAWPGNSRELRAFVARLDVHGEAAALATLPGRGDRAPDDAKNGAERSDAPTGKAGGRSRRGERPPSPAEVIAALAAEGYAVDATAAALGISKTTLYAHMATAGIPRGQDLDEEAIAAALAASGGDVGRAAAALRVSARALRLRRGATGG